MRICYFTPGFPEDDEYTITKGGAENVAYNLAIHIAEKNKVYVFTISEKPANLVGKKGNLEVYRYRRTFGIFNNSVSLSLEYKPLFHSVDIVHIHTGGQLPLLSSFLFKVIKRKPIIVTYHGDFYVKGNILMRGAVKLYNNLQDKLLKLADLVISPSKSYIERSKILRKYKEKIIVIPNGISLNRYNVNYSKEECREKLGLPPHKKLILFLSAIREKKAPDLLIKAMPKVVREISDAYLVMAGKGRMENRVKQMTIEFGIADLVNFPGFVKEGEKPLYFKAADVSVLPSHTENFPVTILEAMACGTPVIGTKVGGIQEIIKNGENGLLVPPGDSVTLADAIIYLLENEDVREKMGENARKKVKDYSWEKIAEITENVYEQVISKQ